MTSIGSNIVSTLGGSSTIDTGSLVKDLVAATRQPRQKVITERQTTNNARISALASAQSAMDTFATALADALKSSNYSGRPASADPSIASISARPGGVPVGLPAQIEVKQLATARTMASTNAAVTAGTYTLDVGGTAHAITLSAVDATPSGLVSAINALNTGVTAKVVTDKTGTRIVLKGALGAANDFTFSGGGLTMNAGPAPTDSIVEIDGVEMINESNTLDDAIPFTRIDLNKAAVGTKVTLATDEPTSSIKDLVKEFVSAFNTLRKALNDVSAPGANAASAGALAGDSGIRDMKKQLTALTTSPLSTGTYKTLSEIGIETNRDGTLKLNETRFDAAVAADPTAVTQLINPSAPSASNPGLAKSVSALRDRLNAEDSALTTSQARYKKLQTELSSQLEKLDTQMTDYETKLTATYATMQTKLSAFKATQSYLEQQVSIWTNAKN